MTMATATHADEESYQNFLRVMNSENASPGEDGAPRRRRPPESARPRDEKHASTAAGGTGPDGEDDAGAPGGAEEAEATSIPESTHSFLFTEPVRSPPFWLGLGVAAISVTSLALALYNNLQDGDVPVNVRGSVKWAAFISILIVLMMEEEIPTGLDLLRRISREDLASRCPEISYPKFAASALLRVAMGYLFLLNVLVVLVYAEGVIEIFYDVLALQFVQQLDDIGFFLCKKDVLGKSALRATMKPCFRKEFHEPRGVGGRSNIHKTVLRMAIFINLVILVAVLTFFSVRQQIGYYQCHSVTVLFGDEVWEDAVLKWPEETATYKEYRKLGWPTESERALVFSFFNGVYATANVASEGRLKARMREGRPIYYERNKADREPFDIGTVPASASPKFESVFDPIQPAEIRYCEGRWVWNHPYIQRKNGLAREGEDCQWLARSPPTHGYDLRESAGLKWELWTGVIVQTEVGIIDNECTSADDCNLNGDCSSQGICECDKGSDDATFLGEQCEIKLKDKCREIVSEVDDATWTVNSMNTSNLPEAYYSRPVYTYVKGTSFNSRLDTELGENDIYLLYYAGLRWYGTILPGFLDADVAAKKFWRWMPKNYHAYWAGAAIYSTQVSNPTQRDTPVGVDFFRIENGDQWVGGEIVRYGVQDEQFGPFGSLISMQKNNQTGRGLYHCARCHFCHGKTLNSGFVLPDGQTCGFIANYAKTVDPGSPVCQNLQCLESSCCGEGSMAASNTTNNAVCSFCQGGMADAAFVVPQSGGRTCEDLAAYASMRVEGSIDCQNLQLAESLCCG